MKITQSVSMLVTLMLLSSGFNNSFAKNIQSVKAFTCSSQADCKKKCEALGSDHTWKSDPSGATHGTCTKKKKVLSSGNSTSRFVAAGTMVAPQPKTPAQLKPVIGHAIQQQVAKHPPSLKPVATRSPNNSSNAIPVAAPKVQGFKKPNLPVISKPTTGIKTVPSIKNNNKVPVKFPMGNVKTVTPALISPTPPGVPAPYPNARQKRSLQQAPISNSSSGFVPTGKPNTGVKTAPVTGGKGFVPELKTTSGFVPPNLQNNNSTGGQQVSDLPGTSFGPDNANGANNTREFDNVITPLKEFENFVVKSDGVVAKATVVVDENHYFLSLNWGDGEVETITLKGIRSTITEENTTDFASRVYKFKHIYKAPINNINKRISIVAKDDMGRNSSASTKDLTLNPRYKLSFYSVILKFPDHLDSIFEENSEIKAELVVRQGAQTLINKTMTKDVRTGGSRISVENEPGQRPIFARWKIEESVFSREISYSDEPINIDLNLSEIDFSDGGLFQSIITAPGRLIQKFGEIAPSKFDGSNSGRMPFTIHPNGAPNGLSGTHRVIYKMGTNEGDIIADFAFDLKLIVPDDSENTMMLSQ